MKTALLSITGALVIICIFLFFSKGCSDRKHDKEIALVRGQLDLCVNAPIKIDTVIVEKVLKDTIFLKYTYKVTDTVYESDAVDWENKTIEQRTYTGTYNHPQFNIDWSAKVTGTLDNLTINPPSLIKSMVITKEKTVDLTKYQDCPKIEKSHLYANMGAFFGSSSGVDVGLAYVRKEGWGLRAGIGSDFNGMVYNAGLFLRLK